MAATPVVVLLSSQFATVVAQWSSQLVGAVLLIILAVPLLSLLAAMKE